MSKRRYTTEEKIKILRELQENGKTISQVSEEYHGVSDFFPLLYCAEEKGFSKNMAFLK